MRKRATTTGGLIKTSVQLAPDQLDRVDRYAGSLGGSRSLAIASLVEKGFRLLKIEQRATRQALKDAV